MNEEQVTKAIIRHLRDNGWQIVCFDFPQSGTGTMLHPNGESNSKNKNGIIPDIVTVKDNLCLFFENKDRFYCQDFIKINMLRTENDYTDDIAKLLSSYSLEKILFGIGIPTKKFSKKAEINKSLTDFIIGVEEDGSIEIIYSNSLIGLM